MEDSTFWIRIWSLVAGVVCTLIIAIGACSANRQYQTRMLIENTGVSPVDARCALDGDSERETQCIIRESRRS